jgi:microcystin-dependent protein
MEGYIGEIRLFAGNFAPRNWALCEGQLLPINSYTAVFSILGTIYGGDGRTTFGLPDLRGRTPIGPGNGPGLSSYNIGQKGGVETVTLNATQIPSHNHTATGQIKSNGGPGDAPSPAGAYFGEANDDIYASSAGGTMASDGVNITVGNAGGNQSHENRQPYLACYYIICLAGIYPSRS